MITFKNRLAGLAGFGFVVALCSLAHADAFDCKPTETQAECFARLHCKAGEEVTDCQKRLRAAAANASGNTSGGNSGGATSGGDRGNDRGGDRGNDRSSDDDRGGGDDRGGDRGDRGGDDRGSRCGGGGDRGRRRRAGGRGGSFEANKTFGLGLELLEPTGLNGKYFFGPRTALDFGVGYAYRHYYYGDGLHLYGDVLFHPVLLSSGPSVEIPFYVGVGLRYWQFDYYDRNDRRYYGSALGIRVPLGISFDFNNAPIDIFLQLVPTLDFINGDYYRYYGHRNHFGADFSVGFRFWFK